MVRRLALSAIVLVVLAFGILTIPPSDFLEALTANLNTLITMDGTLTEGDKTFSNFSFTPVQVSVSTQGGVLTLPSAANITVTTSTGPGGDIMIAFAPFGLSASVGAGVFDFTAGLVSFGFDVSVTGSSDVISAVSVDASLVQDGPFATAGVGANLLSGATVLGFVSTGGIGTAPVPGLQTLSVDATASVLVEGATEDASVDEVVFTVEQTTPSAPVPEPGSLTLILGGAVMLLARGLARRRS